MTAPPDAGAARLEAEEGAALLGRLPGCRLLIVGDVMVDRFVRGRVERISPEAPIPVLNIEGEAVLPGGAANVARNAAGLGAEVELVGVIGEDDEGRRLGSVMAAGAGVAAWLVVDRSRRTTVKTRFLAAGYQLLRADTETTGAVEGDAAARLRRQVEDRIEWAQVLVLSDYGKGVLAGDMAALFIAAARRAGRFVAVDPRGADWERYRGAGLVTPNRRELAEAAGGCDGGLEEVAAAAGRLIRAHGLGAVLVTLSEQGMLAVDGAGGCEHLPALAREVFDVSGAGDTVIAAMATAMAAGAGLGAAARLANVAAGIVVGKLGPAVAWPREILTALGREEGPDQDKVATLAQALDHVRRWRLAGLKVGFTNAG